jgi:hypothetical protein
MNNDIEVPRMKKEFEISTDIKVMSIVVTVAIIILGLVCLTWGVSKIYLGSDQTTGWSFLFLALLQFLSAGLNVATLTTTRLVLSPEQLEFYSPGLTLVTSWDNLQHIGSMSILLGLAKYDSLVLRAATTPKVAWWFKLLRKCPEQEIPMSMFSNWRVSEIGQEIKKYAPHLFSGDASFK